MSGTSVTLQVSLARTALATGSRPQGRSSDGRSACAAGFSVDGVYVRTGWRADDETSVAFCSCADGWGLTSAAVAAFVTGAGVANALRHHRTPKHPSCLQMFPSNRVSGIAGIPLPLRGGVNSAQNSGLWEYKLGSAAGVTSKGMLCIFHSKNDVPPKDWSTWGEAVVGLGWGGKPKLWRQLESLYQSGTDGSSATGAGPRRTARSRLDTEAPRSCSPSTCGRKTDWTPRMPAACPSTTTRSGR